MGEDVPTDFVMKNAFPFAGRLLARPCPEALRVPGLFDPAAPNVLNSILAMYPKTGRTMLSKSRIHGTGVHAAQPLLAGTVVAQLPLSKPIVALKQFRFNHRCRPNAYVDRNRAVRMLCDVAGGKEITLDYALTAKRGASADAAMFINRCHCGHACCRKSVGDWTGLPASTLLHYLRTTPMLREVEEDILSEFGQSSFDCRVPSSEAIAATCSQQPAGRAIAKRSSSG